MKVDEIRFQEDRILIFKVMIMFYSQFVGPEDFVEPSGAVARDRRWLTDDGLEGQRQSLRNIPMGLAWLDR